MSITKAAKRAKFEKAFETIREQLLAHFKAEGMPDTAAEWYRENLDYNVPGGKLNRGLSVVDTAEILKGRSLTDEEYLQAAVLGWGVELVRLILCQTFFPINTIFSSKLSSSFQTISWTRPLPVAPSHAGTAYPRSG